MTVYLLSVITAVGTWAACYGAVLIKREIVQAFRRGLVGLEQERCDLESAPVHCSRELR